MSDSSTNESTADGTAFEDLPYEELRDKAFALAHQRHDLGFFYDLYKHAPSLNAAAAEGGSLGDLSGSIIDVVSAAEETFSGENVGDLEPLFVARFATYLREHE